MESIWRESAQLPQYPQLEGDVSTDVLVIGGGMAGLLCAYQLKKAGVDCIVAERKRIASGVTGDTTAKLTSQHGLIYSKLAKKADWKPPNSICGQTRRPCLNTGHCANVSLAILRNRATPSIPGRECGSWKKN